MRLLYYVVFLIMITTQSIPSITCAGTENIVYDVNGKKVLNNAPYYIGPVIWAKGGGIKLTDTISNKKICPSYVVQDPAEVNKGGQFLFTVIVEEKREKYLLTSRSLGIDSGIPKEGSCQKSTFWQISDPEAKPPANLVTTGGEFEDGVSCFQVVDYPKPTSRKVRSYMLQNCPSFCEGGFPGQPCYNVSIYEAKGVRYLASTGTPFEFVFQKAK